MVIQAIAALIFLPFIVGRSGVYHLHFGRGRVGRELSVGVRAWLAGLGYTGRVDLRVRRGTRCERNSDNC